MMSLDTFEKKQILFVFTREGEKMSFQNDNVIVKNEEGKIRHQSTCYRIFAIYVIGHVTITSVLLEKSKRFGFPIFLMTPSFRTLDMIGHKTEGNFILRKRQYDYSDIGIARHIVKNKIENQADTLRLQRSRGSDINSDIGRLKELAYEAGCFEGGFKGLMGIEGTASKLFFRNNFDMPEWTGRKPRVKNDFINSTLDIGYTVLFNYVDAMLNLYGFDTYRGIYHREFYMRKSLVCDLVEPFRPIIDWQVRKAIHLGQCKPEDFVISDKRYLLSIENNKDYVSFLTKPILENRDVIFSYFQSYYRAFIKGKDIGQYPVFRLKGER